MRVVSQPTAAVCLAAAAILAAAPSLSAQATAVQAPPAAHGVAGLSELSHSLEQLVERVSPSVVQIFVTGYVPPDEEDQTATGEPALERSSGSGVILDSDGYIVTNAHVVEIRDAARGRVAARRDRRGAGRSIVRRRGRNVGAQVVAIDHETDLAVVKVEAQGTAGAAVRRFGHAASGPAGAGVRQPARARLVGHDGRGERGGAAADADDPMIYVQTDAPINPGNSGGALVDTDGRLVGINTLIYTQSGGSEGIGFAAPSNIVRNVFTQIRKTGRVRRGEIGVNPQTVTPLIAEALKLGAGRGRHPGRRHAAAGRRERAGLRARRRRARARRQADGERASVPDQSLHARRSASRSRSRSSAASGS